MGNDWYARCSAKILLSRFLIEKWMHGILLEFVVYVASLLSCSRSYACRKHSLAAVTVHFWPGGRFSSRLGHGRLFLLSAACLRNFLDPGGCCYWKHLESWRSVLLQKKEKTIWPWTLIRVILLEADWYCKVAKCDFSVIMIFR